MGWADDRDAQVMYMDPAAAGTEECGSGGTGLMERMPDASPPSGPPSTGGPGPSFAYANNKLGVGPEFTCAIVDNGSVKCWGRDQYSQLGNGGNKWGGADVRSPASTPIDLGTGRTAVAVAAGSTHACALLDDGNVKCWGFCQHNPVGVEGHCHQPSTNPVIYRLPLVRDALPSRLLLEINSPAPSLTMVL